MYVAIDRKLENGSEIQDSCDGTSKIMMRLKVVKTKDEKDRIRKELGIQDRDLLHGTEVLIFLVAPWGNAIVTRTVVGDSYFASMPACDEMKKLGYHFIGPIKTATKGFCHDFLATLQMTRGRDNHYALYTLDSEEKLDKFAFIWVDRIRMYFVSNTSSTYLGADIERRRYRQIDDTPKAKPEMVDVTVQQLLAGDLYYAGNAAIYEHNRIRQQSFKMEKKLQVKDWQKRLNHSILVIGDVDTYNFRKAMEWSEETPYKFYHFLAQEMINNNESGTTTRLQMQNTLNNVQAVEQQIDFGPRLLKLNRKRSRAVKDDDGTVTGKIETKFCLQQRCKLCKEGRPIWVCSK